MNKNQSQTDSNTLYEQASWANAQQKTYVSEEKFIQKITQLQESMDKMQNDFEKNRFDLITLLGLFVALITYLGLEIQIFKVIQTPFLIVGISLFFISSLLLFILIINTMFKRSSGTEWKDFTNPCFLILVLLLITSILCFYFGTHQYIS